MNPLAKWKWAVLALLVVFIGMQQLRIVDAHLDLAHEQAARAEDDKNRAVLLTKRIAANQERERALVQAGAEQGNTDAKALTALAADNRRLGRLLADRAHRPGPTGSVPGGATAAGGGSAGPRGATGADLYAEDGAVLVGEAARADRYAVALNSCLKQYESARRASTNQGAR